MTTTNGFPAAPLNDTNGKLLCLTICGFRAKGMTEEEYMHHMTKVSGPMTKGLMVKYGVVRWTMLHNTTATRNLMRQLFDAHFVNLAEYDCFSQVYFRSVEDYQRMREDATYKNMISGDHVNFADTQRSSMTIGWVTDFIANGKLIDGDSNVATTSNKAQTAAIITGSLLSGSMMSLAVMAVPVFLDTTPTSPLLFHQWARMYHYGHQVLPGMAIGTFSLYTYACFQKRRARQPASSWRLLALAGLVTVSIIPFTLLVMVPTNDKLFALEASTEALRAGGEAAAKAAGVMGIAEAKALVVKWAAMHATRSTFPLIGAVLGAVATFW